MRRMLGLAALVFVGVLAWRVGGMLSTDAIGMAVGMMFGVLAGIPAALLVLATDRRRHREEDDADDDYYTGPHRQLPAYPQQPPVIVVTSAHPQAQPPQQPVHNNPYHAGSNPASWNSPRPERQFRVVGDREEWVE
jgi:hypothetical protein